jgi:hypothetical protein
MVTQEPDPVRTGFIAFYVSLAANLLVVLASAPLLLATPDSHVRPMSWAMATMAAIGVGLVIGLPLSIVAIARDKLKWLGMVALLLSLTPWPLGGLLLHGIKALIGFELSQ